MVLVAVGILELPVKLGVVQRYRGAARKILKKENVGGAERPGRGSLSKARHAHDAASRHQGKCRSRQKLRQLRCEIAQSSAVALFSLLCASGPAIGQGRIVTREEMRFAAREGRLNRRCQ